MKNLFILPTDKLSRLYLEDEVFILSEYDYPNVDYAQNQHLYITSDEGIKDGDWSLDIDNEIVKYDENKYNMLFHNICKKIILTTDQDLIKDGVQTIDDEFLEWFIKNPSCEKVEVKDSSIVKEHIWDGSNDGEIIWEKEIIIPKEEIINCEYCGGDGVYITADSERVECPICEKGKISKEEPKQKVICTNDICQGECGECNFMTTINVGKQETLEEAAEKYDTLDLNADLHFIAGAKWQQKRMYSEEEVLDILRKSHSIEKTSKMDSWITKWFEQFKKEII